MGDRPDKADVTTVEQKGKETEVKQVGDGRVEDPQDGKSEDKPLVNMADPKEVKGVFGPPKPPDEELDGADAKIVTADGKEVKTGAASEEKKAEDGKPEEKKAEEGEKPKPPDTDGEVSEFDPKYNVKVGDGEYKLSAEAEKEIAAKMEEFKQKMVDSNYEIEIHRGKTEWNPKGGGEGPWNAMMRQRDAAAKKQAAGQEITAQEKALLGLKHDEVLVEARRIRDRDFKVYTTEDGKPRNWYKLNEKTTRWTPEEMEKMAKAQETQLRNEAIAKAKEAEAAKAKEAAEAEARAKAEAAEKEAAAAKETVAATIEQKVPTEEIIAKAQAETGQEGDPAEIRSKMKEHIAKEIEAGTLKPEDLKDGPRIGASYVATGALSSEELTTALDGMKKQNDEAQAKSPPEATIRLGEYLEKLFAAEQARLERLHKASKFHDAFKRMMKEQAEAEAKTEEDPAKKVEEDPTKKVEEDPTKKVEGDPAQKAEEDPTKKVEEDPTKKVEEKKPDESSGDKPKVKAEADKVVDPGAPGGDQYTDVLNQLTS